MDKKATPVVEGGQQNRVGSTLPSTERQRLRELPMLEGIGPLLPGAADKRPTVGDRWPEHPGVSIAQLQAEEPECICWHIGADDHHIAVDVDGAKAAAFCQRHGCDPYTADTWRIIRTGNTERLKLVFKVTPKEKAALAAGGKSVKIDGQELAVFAKPGTQIVVLGNHYTKESLYTKNDDQYAWAGRAPSDAQPLPPEWFALLTGVFCGDRPLRPPTQRTIAPSRPRKANAYSSSSDWENSSQLKPCPVCGRDHSGACSIHRDGESVWCCHGETKSAPDCSKAGETIPGSDGRVWGYAYTEEHDSFGERSLFVLDKPRERATTPATPPPTQQPGKPAAKATANQEPLTFEQRWGLLEIHAAEMACTTWPVMKTVASLACKASELEIPRLGQRQLEQLLEQAQRKVRAKSEPVRGGCTFTIQPTPWAVDGLFRHGLNLLVGQSGAGKSRLAAACMASWLRGDATWLQRPLRGIEARNRHALIVGTDQSLTDWHLTLGPVGLTTKESDTEVRVHDRLTLYGLESGLQLDADGLNTIRRWVDAHPGGMVLVDSLAQCLPAGIDEDKSTAARPVHQLQEVLGDAWAILTHHTRKGAGKEGNIGVGAGRGSGAIDAAVSRVIGLGLIHKMENGQMVAQESDPRRELLSTKRGGKTEHLIVSSDGNGFWDLHGTADALKAQERQQRALSNLTDAQSDVLAAVEGSGGWVSTRDVVKTLLADGEEYDATSGKAATARKALKRLEVLGLIETQRVGNDRSYRAVEPAEQREVEKKGSTSSTVMDKGISLAQPLAQPGSTQPVEPPEPPVKQVEPVEPAEPEVEPPVEPVKTQSQQRLSQLNHPPVQAVQGTGSPPLIGSGADVIDDDDDPHWPKRPEPA